MEPPRERVREIPLLASANLRGDYRVFTRLLEQTKALDATKIKAIKAALSNIMAWRNAFAHGKVIHELNGGFLLQYHSGGCQELVLDDVFFEKFEATVRHCLYTCNDVILAFTRATTSSCERG